MGYLLLKYIQNFNKIYTGSILKELFNELIEWIDQPIIFILQI